MALTSERLHLCYQCGFRNVQKLTLSKSNGFQILCGSQGLIEIWVLCFLFVFCFVVLVFGFLLSKERHEKPTDFRIFTSKYMSTNKGKFYSLASLEMSPM